MVDNNDAGVGVGYVNVEVISRLELLHLGISNFASAFGADEECLNSIKKGVLERQIISEVDLKYYDQEDKIQGLISLKIDWDKYEINIKDDKNNTFKVEKDKPILVQLDQSIREITKHVERMRKNMQIKKIKSAYSYKSEYTNGDKYKEALKYLNHIEIVQEEPPMNDEFTDSIKMIVSKLPELEINIHSKK